MIFDIIDTNHDKYLSIEELKTAMPQFNEIHENFWETHIH
eukprot:CAMPEP_0116876876 /NCGR_PEP_ID=MMETSP0463-20121206/8740_1 /TAXON_ID=181622 /ORGANISM="Strombidinopsis sp, Strain SopsisLIS2011" /LENGTH=39 /DNA_ID= /DNA_START= /DNA_END= /DNA_ORIENTATION=